MDAQSPKVQIQKSKKVGAQNKRRGPDCQWIRSGNHDSGAVQKSGGRSRKRRGRGRLKVGKEGRRKVGR